MVEINDTIEYGAAGCVLKYIEPVKNLTGTLTLARDKFSFKSE